MASEKMFTNSTPHDLTVKISVLQSADSHEVETLDFIVPAQGSQLVRYGNETETRLNGVRAKAVLPDGGEIRLNNVVGVGGSADDDTLNTNDAIFFRLDDGKLQMAASQD